MIMVMIILNMNLLKLINMKTAKFVQEITVIDPDTNENVQLSIYKHQNGGMFGIDSSYLEQAFDDDDEIKIPDVFREYNFIGVTLID